MSEAKTWAGAPIASKVVAGCILALIVWNMRSTDANGDAVSALNTAVTAQSVSIGKWSDSSKQIGESIAAMAEALNAITATLSRHEATLLALQTDSKAMSVLVERIGGGDEELSKRVDEISERLRLLESRQP